MNTKKCKRCGWEYAIDYPERLCRFCHLAFDINWCVRCGNLAERSYSNIYYCKECCVDLRRAYHYISTTVDQSEYAIKFAEWLRLIAAVPTPYTMLTEQEWIKACKYFGKCAICTEDEISTRQFFVPFSSGGRYTAWNIIPVCDLCATEKRRTPNPFKMFATEKNFRLAQRGLDNFPRVLKYLKERFEEVTP